MIYMVHIIWTIHVCSYQSTDKIFKCLKGRPYIGYKITLKSPQGPLHEV